MNLCVRVDLDYVPWDTPDAQEFGHGEPAMVLRLLELGRSAGFKYHWFASNRVLRAFPSIADAILNEGHDLDWLCKRLDQFDLRYANALDRFSTFGISPAGFALRGAFTTDEAARAFPDTLRFATAPAGPAPTGLRFFPVSVRPERDALRAGQTVRAWGEGVRNSLRQSATQGQDMILCVRPQVLAKVDSKLGHFRELVEFSLGINYRLRTLREQLTSTSTN